MIGVSVLQDVVGPSRTVRGFSPRVRIYIGSCRRIEGGTFKSDRGLVGDNALDLSVNLERLAARQASMRLKIQDQLRLPGPVTIAKRHREPLEGRHGQERMEEDQSGRQNTARYRGQTRRSQAARVHDAIEINLVQMLQRLLDGGHSQTRRARFF